MNHHIIEELRDKILKIREARMSSMVNGQSYSIQGSHSVTNYSAKELAVEENRLLRRLARALGYKSRHRYTSIKYPGE